jgi:hypothetical protein
VYPFGYMLSMRIKDNFPQRRWGAEDERK